jgi:hypothetical protein
MKRTKMILAANARILWMMTIPSNRILPNVCIVVARPEGSADEKRAFFSFWTRFTATKVPDGLFGC